MTGLDGIEGVYVIYGASLVVSSAPLIHMLATGRIVPYFVYSITVASFILLNLVGSVSPNVLATGKVISLQLSLFVTALVLAGIYPILLSLRRRTLAARRQDPMLPFSDASEELRQYVLGWGFFALSVVGLFCVFVSPPLIFRSDLYGQWDALIELRSEVVFGANRFHWFALAFFDVPLFVSCVAVIWWRRTKMLGYVCEERRWRHVVIGFLPLFALLSIAFLHKTHLARLILGVFLAMVIVEGRLLRRALWGLVVLALCLVPLYGIYLGLDPDVAPFFLSTVAHRIFEVYSWAAAVALDLFPRHEGYLWGRSLTNFFGIFPYEQVSVAELIYPYIYGIANGTAPAPALYEMYANWGWVGFMIGEYVILFTVVGVSILSWARSPLVVGLSVYLGISLIQMWQSPFWFGALEPTKIILAIIIVAGWHTLRRGSAVRAGGDARSRAH